MAAGHPQLEIGTNWEDGMLTIWIDQKQSGQKTPKSYQLPIDIDIHYGNRVERKSIWVDGRQTVHRFKTKFVPKMVRIDPDDHLLIEVEQVKSKKGLLLQIKKDNGL